MFVKLLNNLERKQRNFQIFQTNKDSVGGWRKKCKKILKINKRGTKDKKYFFAFF